MLSPRYLAGLSDELIDIYSNLENDILQDMARRLEKLKRITDATTWQARMLVEAGGLQKNIARLLSKYDNTIVQEIERIYKDALEKNLNSNNRIFDEATGRTVSDDFAQQMLATIEKTHSDLLSLTMTTASTSQTMFYEQANRAFMKVQSGAFDYDTALKTAVDEMADKGITAVQYENGKPVRRTIEAAVRMNILTGVNQTAAATTIDNCDELGCDLVETSAHIGARPEHARWQGKVFSLSGTSDKYPPFSECGYGTITGICGVNCRHSFYPYFENTEKHYTQDDLDEMSKDKVVYNNKKMTRYDGEQKLRSIERKIRYYKRRTLTERAAGLDTSKSRGLIGKWQEIARDFTKQTGIQRDPVREHIGTKGPQPVAISPARLDLNKNSRLAHKIKRLDNSKKKLIADVPAGPAMSFREADGRKANPNFNKGGGYTINCQSCVVTYELRRRGYDLETLPNVNGSMLSVLSRDTNLAWVDRNTGKPPTYIHPVARNCKQVYNWLCTSPEIKEHHRYTIEFAWKNGGGHIINLYKKNGDISLYDPQVGTVDNGLAAMRYLKDVKPTSVMLLDVESCDVNLNVVNKITRRRKK